jgi:hypothetical protein
VSPSTRAVTAQFDEAAFRDVAKAYTNAASSLKKWEDDYQKYKEQASVDLDPQYVSETDEQLDQRMKSYLAAGQYGATINADSIRRELQKRRNAKDPNKQAAIKNFETVINAFRAEEKSSIERATRLIFGDISKLIPDSEDLEGNRNAAMRYMREDKVGTPVPDEDKIAEIARKRAAELGVPSGVFERRYFDVFKSRVSDAYIMPNVVKTFEQKSAPIYKKYGITPESDDKVIAAAELKVKSIDSEYISSVDALNAQIKAEFAPYSQKYQSSVPGIQLSYDQAVDRIQQDLNNGLVDMPTAEARLKKVNENSQAYLKQQEAEAKKVEEKILAAYHNRFTTLRKDYMSNRALAAESAQRQLEALKLKTKNPKLAEELKAAFEESYGQMSKALQDVRVSLANPALATIAAFLKSTGGVIKSFASAVDLPALGISAYGVSEMYELGDYLENSYVTEEVDISSFKSWLPGYGFGTLTGNLLGTATPTIVTGITTAPLGGAGVGVALWAVNTLQLTGSARNQRFSMTGSEYEADKAASETLKSQIAYAPLALVEALPFVGAFSQLGKKLPIGLARLERPIQVGLGGATEVAKETVQEMLEGSTEQSVLQGGGAFDQLGQDLLDANKWKQTLISVGPAGLQGMAEPLTSPTRRGLANEFLAQRAADRLGNSYQNAWIVNNAFRDPVAARASIDLMFANGSIDQDMRTTLKQKLDATVANIGKADKLGLGGQRKYVYASMATALDDLKAKANVESDPVTKQVLDDRIKVATKGLVDFANNKGGSYFMITMSNDVPMVQTEEGMAGLLADSEFVDGAINASNINIRAFGKTSPEVQKSLKDIFDKRKQLKAQQDAVQERAATQVGAQPGGAEGAGQAGGEGMGPGVQGTQAAQAVNPQERLNEVRQRITQIEEARDQGLTLEGMQPGELANLKNEEQQLMDAIATGPVRPGQAPAPSLATEPQTRTTFLFEQLDRMRSNMAGMKRRERKDTQKRLNQMLTQDARLAEVDAKFASMAADLERQGKLKRRCP